MNEKLEKETEFLSMLNVLLSTKKNVEEKKRELESRFHIDMETKMERELNFMCNLSDWVEEVAMERGMARGMEKGMELKLKEQVAKKLKKNLSIEKIADDLEEVVEVIRRIVIEIEAETN